jgi:hypothetical protein
VISTGTVTAVLAGTASAVPALDPGPTTVTAPARSGAGDPVRVWDPTTPPAPGSRHAPRVTGRAPEPLAKTFELHSLPGSQHTIFLDFDGGTVSGTAWNGSGIGLAPGGYRGWVLGGDPAMKADQLRAVQRIWQRVAEDFAPFDVDVTTQDPGDDALDRSGPTDPAYGTRVLVTSSREAARTVCPTACSGSSWVDVFDLTPSHAFYQPSWVFPEMVGNDTKDVAEVISHEVGHTFGLQHDGDARSAYDYGHRSWAPIMGAAFFRPITQWSRGGYAGANNQQDDLAVIASHGAPVRADEAVGTVTGAGPPPTGPAYITTDADRDVYDLGRCSGEVVLTALPAPVGPNLDIRLRLLAADGSTLVTADPPSKKLSASRATGLSAKIKVTVAPGDYFASVTGVGRLGALVGYDGYGSLGAYTLRWSGCRG